MSSPKRTSLGPVIDREELVHSEKWVCMKKLHWTDARGRKRVWETAERTTRTKSGMGADAVTMFVRLFKLGCPTKTLVISQFRPPLNTWSIEFPAGLIDEGETPEEAARRELEEETGFIASEVTLSYPLANDPGMSNTSQILCITNVDLDDPRNQNAKPRLDDEFIVTHFVEIPSLLETIERMYQHLFYPSTRKSMLLMPIETRKLRFTDFLFVVRFSRFNPSEFNAKGYLIDAGVYYFALALKMKE